MVAYTTGPSDHREDRMAEVNLLVETRESGPWSIVDVKGEVDLYTAPKLKDRLVDIITGGRNRIVVNLEAVEFLDSSGLGALISGLKRCREAGGTLALTNASAPVRKVLAITGLDRVFPLHETVEQATSS